MLRLLTQFFPIIIDGLTRWTVLKRAIQFVSQPLIKLRSLIVRGGKTRILAASLPRFLFCSLHKLAAYAFMTQAFIDPHHADFKPHRYAIRSAYQSRENSSRPVRYIDM